MLHINYFINLIFLNVNKNFKYLVKKLVLNTV
jgi:hypothetical protein